LETIKSSTDISFLFAQGKRYSASCITLLVYKGREQHDPRGRVAFVAGKKLGNAVWRNRSKRRMRAICQDIGGPWPGFDVVFIAKPSTIRQKYSKVSAACELLIRRSMDECC